MAMVDERILLLLSDAKNLIDAAKRNHQSDEWIERADEWENRLDDMDPELFGAVCTPDFHAMVEAATWAICEAFTLDGLPPTLHYNHRKAAEVAIEAALTAEGEKSA